MCVSRPIYVALLILLGVLGAHPPLCAQPPDSDAKAALTPDLVKPDAKADESDEQKLKDVVEELSALVKVSDIAKLESRITKSGKKEFAVEAVMLVSDLVTWSDGVDAGVLKKIKAVYKKFAMDKLNTEPGDDIRSEEDMAAFEAKLFKELGDDAKRIEMLTAIYKATSNADFEMNPFMGKIVSVKVDGEKANVELRLGEGEADDVDMVLMFSEGRDGDWLWDGVDYDAIFEADEAREKTLLKDLTLAGKSAKGKQVALKDYRGKFVLVDFWGTWCGPCVAELPGLKKIHGALKDKGFEVLGVAADDQESLDAFLKKTPLSWDNIVDGEMKICERLRVNAFPTTLLIDKSGENVVKNVFGVELLDELVQRMELESGDYADLRRELASHDGTHGGDKDEDEGEAPPVGFEPADADHDEKVSKKELRTYLMDRLGDDELPHGKIFKRLDEDKDGMVSQSEFDNRHAVITHFMGDDYFGSVSMRDPKDPGPGYVLFNGIDQPVDDRAVMGAVFHRMREAVAIKPTIELVDLRQVPKSLAASRKPRTESKDKPSVADLAHSTVTIAGGGRDFFTAGAVVVSRDGLAVTNYHVAEALADYPLVGLTSDGKPHRVLEFLAGNKQRDIALIRLEGEGFHPTKIAEATPGMGSDIVMMHHSENRFFTYDRGYVMRHPMVGDHPWLQISADYAPGGSGCGIYNGNHELIGLVSTVLYGDGPSLAEDSGFDEDPSEESPEMNTSEKEAGGEDDMVPSEYGMLLVKHAVPLSAIKMLWSSDESKDDSAH